MPASLTIRDIPRPVLTRLRALAAGHRRSMQGEVLAILEAAVAAPTTRRTASQVLQQVRALGIASRSEATAMIRSDRDER
jgi:plasmid stability protein